MECRVGVMRVERYHITSQQELFCQLNTLESRRCEGRGRGKSTEVSNPLHILNLQITACFPFHQSIPCLDLLAPFKTLESLNRYQTVYNLQQIPYKSGKVPDGIKKIQKKAVKTKTPPFSTRTREKFMLIKPITAVCLGLKMQYGEFRKSNLHR